MGRVESRAAGELFAGRVRCGLEFAILFELTSHGGNVIIR
jgi:hypothetical protein